MAPPEVDVFIRSDQRALHIYLGFVLVVIFLGVVLVAGVWLWMTLSTVRKAHSELNGVQVQLVQTEARLANARQAEAAACASAVKAEEDLAQAVAAREQTELKQKAATEALKETRMELGEATAAKDRMSDQVDRFREEVSELEGELKKSTDQLVKLQAQLREAAKFDDHRYELNWAEVKSIAARQPGAEGLFMRISELQHENIGWSMSNTPREGFHSPGFAQFVLGRPLSELRRVEDPRPGDVVVYDSGYAMFYFVDRDGTRFVVGMTPIGIVSLKYNFGAKQLYTLRVPNN